MCGARPRLPLHPLVIAVLTAFSAVVAGVPLPSTVPRPNAGERCIVRCQASGTGEDAVKPRGAEDSEKSEEEEEAPEFDIVVDGASVLSRDDDACSYVSVVDGTIGDRQHSSTSSIRGPPVA